MTNKLSQVEFRIDYPNNTNLLDILSEIQHYYSLNKYLFKAFPKLKNKTNEEIADCFIDNKKEILKRVKNRRIIIAVEWKKVESKYFEKIKKLTGYEWKKSKYICYVSPIDAGRYMFEINAIVCFAFDDNLNETINTIAEELFHLHFWYCLERYGFELNKEIFSKYWKLSEAVIGFVLPEIGFKLGRSWWGKEMKGLERELIPIWKNRNSFKDFLIQSIKIAEKVTT